MNWHTLTIPEVLHLLGSSRKGLSAAAAREGLAQWGPNELQEGKRKSRLHMLAAQFSDVMILILLAAAVISGIIGDLTDTIVILVIVILNAFIGFLEGSRAEKAMQALKKMSVVQTDVMRDGQVWQMSAVALVPGDIVLLEAGDAVPADMRLTEAFNLKVEEAALTGESQDIAKTSEPLKTDQLPVADRTNLVFNGAYVTSGRGAGVVVATGMHTELGRIAGMLQEKETLTPLQQRMAVFGKKLSLVVLLLCGLFFITGWLRGENTLRMLLTGISLAVAAIPEALPAVITIALALAAKKMIRFHCLIRQLPAVETLGSVTYICTDKTGTLTHNKMQVEEVFAGGRSFRRDQLRLLKETEQGSLLLQAFALNNDAVANGDGRITGDSTEVALLTAVTNLDMQVQGPPRLAEIVFDADRKLMTTFHAKDGKVIAFTKGAPDILLERTNAQDKDILRRQIDQMAAGGQRVLGFAYRYWDTLPNDPDSSRHESALHFLGLAGIVDPPREEIRDAVAQCRSAGIVPVMITGDHPLTARAIAEQTGILQDKANLVVTGRDLAVMSQAQFSAEIEHIRVYARVTPEQKLRIVKTLQEKGHFVAMTGDGVNDAPSLKRADIGIAMGITGTDVAKQAADMILLGDNFSTIVKAVREGRRIYDNILKF
ncbi:MAG TPA: HAD-IC family P-type ATPase, partial [Puia sp.]|nr:HAD-IC family P-type ATPase [Puia sp.]